MKKKSRKFYDVLGVKPEASQDDIKKAFRSKAKGCHPDHHPGNVEKEGEFKELSAAYHVLGDADSRRQYDESGEAPPVDNLLADTMQMIIVTFRSLRDAKGDGIFSIDPLREMAAHFTAAEAEHNGGIRKIEQSNAKNEKLMKKLTHKRGKNQSFLHMALMEENRQNDATISKMKREITMLQKARELLAEFSYSADKKAENVNDRRAWRFIIDESDPTLNFRPWSPTS